MKVFTTLIVLTGLVFSLQATAKTCELSITGDDRLQFSKSEMKVSADCDKVKVTLEHVGELPVEHMGHNWVLAETSDWEALAQAGQGQGLDNEYLPAGDDRIIAHTDLIGGGETTSVTFDMSKLEKGGEYTFFCSFPGHPTVMNGEFIVE